MPRKIRELITELEQAGFLLRSGRGSHLNFSHPDCPMIVTISGKSGDDAKPYQEKAVTTALKMVEKT